MIAQKNAERAAMRSHFRRKYQLSESPKDRNHLRSAGGKVSLPKELSKMIHPETKSKDDGFNLLSAFQGLSFSTAALTQSKHSKAPTPPHGESCRVIASGSSGPRFLGPAQPKALCMTAAGTVVDGKLETVKAVRKRGVDGRVRRFEEIPHTGRNGWINLLKFWRENRFQQLHKHMERTFNALGPIYREKVGTLSSVNILLPSDISELFKSEGLHPRRMTLEPWATHRETRNHRKGVFLKNGEEWRSDRLQLNKEVMMSAAVRRFLPLLDDVAKDFCRMLDDRVEREGRRAEEAKRSLTIDPSPDLFRFALEASCHVLYGERIGLFSSSPSLESQKFIWAVERMLTTTPPLLYLPPRLLLRPEARIQKAYQRLSSSGTMAAGGLYSGVLGQLMEKGKLSLDLIKANITELMAGGVDTVSSLKSPFVLHADSRAPAVWSCLSWDATRRCRTGSGSRSRGHGHRRVGDPQKALQGAPLLKGTIKEILRLYPVGITVQRYPVKDIVLQNYHIPAGVSFYICLIVCFKAVVLASAPPQTMVQACLYPMGRSSQVFEEPLNFDPGRWSSSREEGQRGEVMGFRSLAFGFGARQCVGRRIAENEMQLLLMHILLRFHLSVPSSEDLQTTATLILQPKTPPRITFSKL
ncbi:Cytochrome P450 11B, mitochondrial [Oryzias melastigma]|uniref:steroid 11beta-monooxygenase n=1 Tax=Oryzias melastigma TaxID=30732 RepID=A0A834L2Y1_ORYME|nr:Cytochrome P450 11B, mitochondrial [Oryzias melastigma]